MNLVNGKPSSSISIFDRGFLYGDSVFETILVLDKKPKNIEGKWFHKKELALIAIPKPIFNRLLIDG